MTEPETTTADQAGTSRRAVLYGAGAVGVAAVLAGCSDSGGDSGASSAPSDDSTSSAPSASASSDDSGGGGGIALGSAAGIAVGGGKVFADQKIVVTQPTAGQYKAFSAVCTHMGCTVGKVDKGLIMCPCHGSQYNIADGSVKNGPAPSPLAPKEIEVEGGQIKVS